jgi:hypothetical protein
MQRIANSATVASSPACKPQKETFAATRPHFGQTSEFKLVIAYDDFGNANCARWLFERLVANLGQSFTFIPRFLKFEELSRPDVGDRLAKEVGVADMVVIVAYEHTDLPDLAKEWVRAWDSTSSIKGRRLLAFLSTGHRENDQWTPVQSRLRQAARRTGMKFVLQSASPSYTGRQLAAANPIARRQVGERRRTGRNLCCVGGSLENAGRCSVSGEVSADLQPTAVTNAIIEVVRTRQRKTQPSTIPLASRGCMRSLEMNRIRIFANL